MEAAVESLSPIMRTLHNFISSFRGVLFSVEGRRVIVSKRCRPRNVGGPEVTS